MNAVDFTGIVREDGSATILGRLVARDGTGAATGVNGEGNFLKVADISTITCAIFDLDSSTPETSISAPDVTVATDVLDTPVTTNVLWTKDTTGYNFLHDLASTSFPIGGRNYVVEYKITTTGGTVGWGRGVLEALKVNTS